MKKCLGIFSILLLAGAGCTTNQTTPHNFNTNIQKNACIYENKELAIGESYNDGCNTHTCQEDGTIISTEIACEIAD